MGSQQTSYLLISAISSSIRCSVGAAWSACPRSAVDAEYDSLLATDCRRIGPEPEADKEVDRLFIVLLVVPAPWCPLVVFGRGMMGRPIAGESGWRLELYGVRMAGGLKLSCRQSQGSRRSLARMQQGGCWCVVGSMSQ